MKFLFRTTIIFILCIIMIHSFLNYLDNKRLNEFKLAIPINSKTLKEIEIINDFILNNLPTLTTSTENHRQGVPKLNTLGGDKYYYFTSPWMIRKYVGKTPRELDNIESFFEKSGYPLQINYNYKNKTFWYEFNSGVVSGISYKHQLWFHLPNERLQYFTKFHQFLDVVKLDKNWTYIICITHDDKDDLNCESQELPAQINLTKN